MADIKWIKLDVEHTSGIDTFMSRHHIVPIQLTDKKIKVLGI